MSHLLNSDNGYSNIKVFGGQNYLETPSLVCEEKDFALIQETSDTRDCMVCEVSYKEGKKEVIRNLVIGNKAKSGRARYNFETDKISSDNTVYPTIASFAYILLNNNIESTDLDITTTLTIDDYKVDSNIQKFKDTFCKEWKVKFKYGHLKNRECKFTINNNSTSAQGILGIWDYVLNDKGAIIKDIARKNILAIDIGFETTDICIMDKMTFDDARSSTITVGMSDYNNLIIKQINNKLGLRKSIEDMEANLILGTVGNYNISDIQNYYYNNLVKEIISQLTLVAPSMNEFTDIILLGGGAEKTHHLFQNMPGFNNIVKIHEPVLSNVRGGRKITKMAWGDRDYANL